MDYDREAIKIISECVGKQLLNSNPISGFIVSYVEAVKARQAERKLNRCMEMLESLQKTWMNHKRALMRNM